MAGSFGSAWILAIVMQARITIPTSVVAMPVSTSFCGFVILSSPRLASRAPSMSRTRSAFLMSPWQSGNRKVSAFCFKSWYSAKSNRYSCLQASAMTTSPCPRKSPSSHRISCLWQELSPSPTRLSLFFVASIPSLLRVLLFESVWALLPRVPLNPARCLRTDTRARLQFNRRAGVESDRARRHCFLVTLVTALERAGILSSLCSPGTVSRRSVRVYPRLLSSNPPCAGIKQVPAVRVQWRIAASELGCSYRIIGRTASCSMRPSPRSATCW